MTEKTFGSKADLHYTEKRYAYLIALDRGGVHVLSNGKQTMLPGGEIMETTSHEKTILGACIDQTGFDVSVEDFITDADAYDNTSAEHRTCTYYSGSFLEEIAPACDPTLKHTTLPLIDLDRLTDPMDRWAVLACMDMLRADAHGSDDEDL